MTDGPRGYGPRLGTICTTGMTYGPSPAEPLGAQSKKSKQVLETGSRVGFFNMDDHRRGPVVPEIVAVTGDLEPRLDRGRAAFVAPHEPALAIARLLVCNGETPGVPGEPLFPQPARVSSPRRRSGLARRPLARWGRHRARHGSGGSMLLPLFLTTSLPSTSFACPLYAAFTHAPHHFPL